MISPNSSSFPRLNLNLPSSSRDALVSSKSRDDGKGAADELLGIAKKLGEFIVFQDLNILLSYKHEHDRLKESRAKRNTELINNTELMRIVQEQVC